MKLRHLPAIAVACAGIALLAGTVPAQTSFVYAFSQLGKVSANAYPLDKLSESQGSPDDEIWWDLFVHGGDRWLVRGDGKVALNGKVTATLSTDQHWRGIVVDDTNTFFALSRGGRVSGIGGIIIDYTADPYYFSDIITDGTNVYVLKTNGAVFHVPDTDPIIKFDGPPGEISGSSNDGEAPDTVWGRMLINPSTGQMWALRQDGVIKSADIPATPPVTPDGGATEAALPYDDSDDIIDPDELYYDFTFAEDATWYALRADGRLFSPAALGPPLVDYPGEPSDDTDQTYESVLAVAGHTLVLRFDGKVFRDLQTTAVTDLKSDNYRRLAFGTVLPDLTNVTNQPPVGSSMTVVAPVGADVELPVIATDRDKATADLVVDVEPDTLPAGATWDGGTRTISWPAAGPVGTYKVKVTVNDGIAKPVKAVQTITIKPVDANPDKNIKPTVAKVQKAIALVALPFTLPILAYDRDGDTLTLTWDTSSGTPPAGTAFDDVAALFTWNAPLIADVGKVPFKFVATDGTAQTKRKITVKVESSLLAF